MTLHFNCIIKASGHQYRWLARGDDPGNGTFPEVVSMVVTWWIDILRRVCYYGYYYYGNDSNLHMPPHKHCRIHFPSQDPEAATLVTALKSASV